MTQTQYFPANTTSTSSRPAEGDPHQSSGSYFAAGLLTLASLGLTVGNVNLPDVKQSDWTPISVTVVSRASTTPEGTASLADRVQDLKDTSGLSWTQFALLFGVTRRAAHFWVRGGNMTDYHVARLSSLQRTLAPAMGLDPRSTRAKLLTPDSTGASIYSRWVAQVQAEAPAGPSAIDLLGANPDSPYIRSRVLGAKPAKLEQREL
jgi:hypothetical protein